MNEKTNDPAPQPTEAYLLRHLDQLSQDWVTDVSKALEQQGRLLEGGWPGTMSEARNRVHKHCACISQPLLPHESDRLANALWGRAKRIWLTCSTRRHSTGYPPSRQR